MASSLLKFWISVFAPALALTCSLARADFGTFSQSDFGGYIATTYKHSENNDHYNTGDLAQASVAALVFSHRATAYLDIAGHVRTDVGDVENGALQVPFLTADMHTDVLDAASVGVRFGLMRSRYGFLSEIRVDPYNTLMNDIPSAVYPKAFDVFATGNQAADFYAKTFIDDWVLMASVQILEDMTIEDKDTAANLLATFASGLYGYNDFSASGIRFLNAGAFSDKYALNFSQIRFIFDFENVQAQGIPFPFDINLDAHFNAISAKFFTSENLFFMVEHLYVDEAHYMGEPISGYKAIITSAFYDVGRWRAYASYSHGWYSDPSEGGEYMEFMGLPKHITYIHEYIVGAETRLPTEQRVKLRGEIHYNRGFFSGDYSQVDLFDIKKHWGFASVSLIWAF